MKKTCRTNCAEPEDEKQEHVQNYKGPPVEGPN